MTRGARVTLPPYGWALEEEEEVKPKVDADGVLIREDRRGSAMSGRCPKQGYIILTAKGNRGQVELPTFCKTWRCVACRKKLSSFVKMKAALGCLRLGRCAFTTVTYRWESGISWDAASARAQWKELLRSSTSLRSPRQWMRVPELTKNGMPHYHLILGPIANEEKIACYGKTDFLMARFRASFKTCGCLSHALSRDWLRITGDTEIVHAQEVYGAAQAASYVAKYLGKTFGDRTALEAMGFARRYSSSRGWPAGQRLRLIESKGAGGPGWARRELRNGLLEEGGEPSLLVRVGDQMLLEILARQQQLAPSRKMTEITRRYTDEPFTNLR